MKWKLELQQLLRNEQWAKILNIWMQKFVNCVYLTFKQLHACMHRIIQFTWSDGNESEDMNWMKVEQFTERGRNKCLNKLQYVCLCNI